MRSNWHWWRIEPWDYRLTLGLGADNCERWNYRHTLEKWRLIAGSWGCGHPQTDTDADAQVDAVKVDI